MILVSADDMNIGKLAEMADRIMDVGTPMVTAVSTSTEDDRMHKIFHEEFNKQHRSCLEVFLIQIEEVGTVHVGGPLHVDVHVTEKQTRTMSVGTTRNSMRMPESVVHHAWREMLGPAASGDQRGWPTNGSSFILHRSRIQAMLPC